MTKSHLEKGKETLTKIFNEKAQGLVPTLFLATDAKLNPYQKAVNRDKLAKLHAQFTVLCESLSSNTSNDEWLEPIDNKPKP